MKGCIYMPAVCKNYVGDRYEALFRIFEKKLNFKFSFEDYPDIPKGTDIVIVYGPQHSWPYVYNNLKTLDKKIKIIGYLGDLWPWGNKKFELELFPRMLDRYDTIISFLYDGFMTFCEKWKDKFVFFPNYIDYEKYSSLNIQDNPIHKLLITGADGASFYPLRTYIRNNIDKDKSIIIRHPGGVLTSKQLKSENVYVGYRYAQLLNKYSCGLSTSTIHKFAVAKHFEIAGAGSLLITDDCQDAKKIGFIPYKHFIPITKENCLETIYECIDNPEKYRHIREEGQKFILENHTTLNRFEELKKIIEDTLEK